MQTATVMTASLRLFNFKRSSRTNVHMHIRTSITLKTINISRRMQRGLKLHIVKKLQHMA